MRRQRPGTPVAPAPQAASGRVLPLPPRPEKHRADDLFNWPVSIPQEIEEYHFGRRDRRRHDSELRGRPLDPIPPRLVGCADFRNALNKVKNASWTRCVHWGLRLMLADSDPDRADLAVRTRAEYLATCKERRIHDSAWHRAVEPGTLEAIFASKLVGVSAAPGQPPMPLFERICEGIRDEVATPNAQDHSKMIYNRAFLVPKGPKMSRLIVDARWANAWFTGNVPQFSLYTIETVKQVIANLQGAAGRVPWYALNCDFKHYFHQMRLPERLKKYFAIAIPLGDGFFMTIGCNTAPMGFTAIPFIAQCLTWSLVLAPHNGVVNPKLGIDRAHLERLAQRRECDGPPAWIPLDCGGAVFVILDNVLVVTNDKERAALWTTHLRQRARDAHVQFKFDLAKSSKHASAEYPLDDAVVRDLITEQCLHTMTPGGTDTFDFNGIRWAHSTCTVPIEGDEEHDPHRFKNTTSVQFADGRMDQQVSWAGTRRDAASALGRVMWHRRIHGKKLYELDDDSRLLRELYCDLAPPPSDKPGSGWDEPFTTMTAAQLQALLRAWVDRAAQRPCTLVPMLTSNPTYVRIATDASKSCIASYDYDAQLPDTDVWTQHFPSNGVIAVSELAALQLGVQRAVDARLRRQVPAPIVVIAAVDNTNVRSWVTRGTAENRDAMRRVVELRNYLDQHRARLVVVYVHTTENAADAPSRGMPLSQTALDATLRVLNQAHIDDWLVHGGLVGNGEPLSR
jgi:hypothetical protein